MKTRILNVEVHGCKDCIAAYYSEFGWSCNIMEESMTVKMYREIDRSVRAIKEKYFFPSWCPLEEKKDESEQ